MKRTPLYNVHVDSGGKMVEFAGYMMPVQYTSILEEHIAVRTAAGLFDVSHMGEFSVKGPAAAEYLAGLVPTSMSKLEPGKGMYTLFCRENGCVIDDLFIFMIGYGDYYLVVNASTAEKDFAWMKEHLSAGVALEDVSSSTAKIDIQGPMSGAVMKEIFDEEKIQGLGRFRFFDDTFSGDRVMISATGYTGEAGYEIFIENSKAVELWNRLMAEGGPHGLKPAGLGARDTLRLESCYSLYGHEISETINPVEAGLGWIISSDARYTGRDELLRLKNGGAVREQVCIELAERGIPRDGFRVEQFGRDIGYVTSGVYSPTFKKGLALALVNKGILQPGDTVDVVIREKRTKGKIVKKPFYLYNG